jgi:hypothetical protein
MIAYSPILDAEGWEEAIHPGRALESVADSVKLIEAPEPWTYSFSFPNSSISTEHSWADFRSSLNKKNAISCFPALSGSSI